MPQLPLLVRLALLCAAAVAPAFAAITLTASAAPAGRTSATLGVNMGHNHGATAAKASHP